MLLELHEIESLCDTCELPFKDLTQECSLRSLEAQILSNTTAHRIRAIKDYLVWLSRTFLSQTPNFGLKTLTLNNPIKLVESGLTAGIPKHSTTSPINAKRGLAVDLPD